MLDSIGRAHAHYYMRCMVYVNSQKKELIDLELSYAHKIDERWAKRKIGPSYMLHLYNNLHQIFIQIHLGLGAKHTNLKSSVRMHLREPTLSILMIEYE